jgi:hypothetical protein
MTDDEERCSRCRRLAPSPDAVEYLEWEAADDGEAMICPGCLTGGEEQAIDEDMFAVEDEAAWGHTRTAPIPPDQEPRAN